MTKQQKVYLKKGEERRLLQGHLWVFSNEIDAKHSPLKSFSKGEIVNVYSTAQQFIGKGYINPHSLIAIRILSKEKSQVFDEDFFIERIQKAYLLRQRLFAQHFYRLVFSESDFLPGLVIDRYDNVFVIQITTAGMELLLENIISALKKLFDVKTIILKNEHSMRAIEQLESYVNVIGEPIETIELIENNMKFHVPLLQGQKTGWFFDHQLNRSLLQKFVKDKTVLDLFCYCGAWGIHAGNYGAKEITFVDTSKQAIEWTEKNIALNHLKNNSTTIVNDAFDALTHFYNEKKFFDVIILDPPAFIKRQKDMEQGMIAYQRLHELALKVLSDDGIIFSASCSQHLTPHLLLSTIRKSAYKKKISLQIIAEGQQNFDHPIHPMIPETHYLKMFVLRKC